MVTAPFLNVLIFRPKRNQPGYGQCPQRNQPHDLCQMGLYCSPQKNPSLLLQKIGILPFRNFSPLSAK